ncbi:SCPU domain-containing protein [Dyella monticola]|uniref:SCPU domain-containing protein n=1 Tax=Dyella monticola TaxID=1927958 RepID=A0A370WTQ0_9GAMM|nr:spore coat U domain-containing protein [Dyella monticola]RDS79325.1 SCPU domain-containing protein [Dyella monticola]
MPAFMVAVLYLYPSVAPAQSTTCSATTTGVSFGTYDPFASAPLDSTGSVSVTCSASTSYIVALSAGQGSFASRTMSSGAHLLAYNLYTDTLRTTVWGDGSGSTTTVPGSGTSASYTVYGRVPALQNAYVGAYSDSIIVTVSF